MPKQPDLRTEAALFADRLANLLNRTVTHGIRIRSAMTAEGRALVGYEVSQDNFVPSPIPLTISASPPRLHVDLSHRLHLSDRGHLTVGSSVYALYLDAAEDSEGLLHYDFERGKADYPEAHLQVHGQSGDWEKLFERAGRTQHASLERLHLPVGGKRFRPCLEDLIEFLICEDLVARHDGWEEALEESRAEYHRRQLSAAVISDPDTAREALAALDAE